MAKILDLDIGQDIPKPKIFHKISVQILDLGSWYFQDFSQESCGNLGSWILVFPRFYPGILWESWILDLGISKILARNLVGILDLGFCC